MKKPKHSLIKLIGLTIDTNAHKFEFVEPGDEKEVYDTLEGYCGLKNLRRIKGTNTFTAYTHHGNLGETLEQYLSE
ncbi:MAG: hypothetical protein IPJ00_17340 [Saprospirales bacterium]|nr:hypothetical protein [Saprospirales bacterium]